MSTEITLNFPTIYLEKNKAKDLFIESIVSTGFAIVKTVNLDFILLQELYRMWYDFFLNGEKDKHPYTESLNEGYHPYALNINEKFKIIGLVESFYYNNCSKLDIDENLIKITNAIYDQLLCITKKLFLWLVNACNTEVNMLQVFGLSKTCYRVMHCPPIIGTNLDKEIEKYLFNDTSSTYTSFENKFRLPPHKDYSYLTLLPRSKAITGLEILYNGEWAKVSDEISDGIIVNIGNKMQLISHGFFKSTMHRVSIPCNYEELNKSRMSSAFFI